MPWLVLQDGEEDELEVLIVEEGAGKRVVPIGGAKTRAFDGTLRATISIEKAEWDLTTLPLSEEDATAIEAMFANGNQFTVSGDMVGEAEHTCMGTVVESSFIIDQLLHRRQLRLLLQEV